MKKRRVELAAEFLNQHGGGRILPLLQTGAKRGIQRDLARTIGEIDTQVSRARRLRHSLLQSALEGRITPQDPNDEPASDLIKRVSAEGSHSATKTKTVHNRRMKASPR